MPPTGPMMDGGFGLWQLVLLVLYVFLLIFPVARILGRAGLSGWWSILALIPVVNLLALWIFAFVDWPRLRGGGLGERS